MNIEIQMDKQGTSRPVQPRSSQFSAIEVLSINTSIDNTFRSLTKRLNTSSRGVLSFQPKPIQALRLVMGTRCQTSDLADVDDPSSQDLDPRSVLPGAPSSFLLLVVRPGAPSSVLAPFVVMASNLIAMASTS